jgi:hypothetical protein
MSGLAASAHFGEMQHECFSDDPDCGNLGHLHNSGRKSVPDMIRGSGRAHQRVRHSRMRMDRT